MREKKIVPDGPGESWDGTLTKEDLELAERYRLWCQSAYHFYGDCLGGALVAGRYLDMQGRYVWALAMSKSPVLDEMKKALGEMVEFRALISAALWTLGSFLLILALTPVAPGLVSSGERRRARSPCCWLRPLAQQCSCSRRRCRRCPAQFRSPCRPRGKQESLCLRWGLYRRSR